MQCGTASCALLAEPILLGTADGIGQRIRSTVSWKEAQTMTSAPPRGLAGRGRWRAFAVRWRSGAASVATVEEVVDHLVDETAPAE